MFFDDYNDFFFNTDMQYQILLLHINISTRLYCFKVFYLLQMIYSQLQGLKRLFLFNNNLLLIHNFMISVNHYHP